MSTPPQVAKPGSSAPTGGHAGSGQAPAPAPRRTRSFLEQIQNSIVVADGAMGTMLYSRGIFLNRCFDELCLSNPALVGDIHAQYLAAGAEVLTTNTFGANRFKLQPHGLEDKVRHLNRVAAELARAVAGDKAWIAGSVGPTGAQLHPLGPLAPKDVEAAFREQIAGLVEGSADLIVLETFHALPEILAALRAARAAAPDLPVVASFSFDRNRLTNVGVSPEEAVAFAEKEGADVLGVNCSTGPNDVLEVVERMGKLTKIPISAMPNAGLPREVQNRLIFLATPEYMASYARRFIRAGASMVGGCCGTTPEHIKEMRIYVRQLVPMKTATRVEVVEEKKAPPREAKRPEEKTPLGAKLGKKFVVSVEIDPPRGTDPSKAVEGAKLLTAAGVDAINIADGPRASARMSPLALAILMQQQGAEPILHYCCRDRNLLCMQADLIGLNAIGLKNVLIITGDPPKMGDYPDATAVFDVDSIGLTRFASRLNVGLDMAGKELGDPTSLLLGVGANPGSIDLDTEVERFKLKLEAGAEYCLTQPVYDVRYLEEFLKRVRPVQIPILVGILPLQSFRNAEFLHNEVPGMSIPAEIRERMRKASDVSKEAAQAEGIAISREALAAAKKFPEIQGCYVMPPFGRYTAALEVLTVL
jgi:methionine synthase / methylenetetrahydrofolate reductase(NADPH)